MGHASDDPGWPRLPSIVLMLRPGATQSWVQRQGRGGTDGLFTLRLIVVTFSYAIIAFGVVVAFVAGSEEESVMPWLVIVLAHAAGVVVVTRLLNPPPNCSSERSLAGWYRSRFFLRLAFAESVALFAFVFTFIGAPVWIYFVGAAFTLWQFWTTAAPTRSALEREQDALNVRGCAISLVAALRSNPAPPR